MADEHPEPNNTDLTEEHIMADEHSACRGPRAASCPGRTCPPDSSGFDGHRGRRGRFLSACLRRAGTVVAACLALAATTVTNAVGAATVTSIALTSSPSSFGYYRRNQNVEATVSFDAAVDITGTPQLELDFNGTAKAAACVDATNTTTMVCRYRVARGDLAPNGIAIKANKLTGGTITDTGSTSAADLDHGAVPIDAAHKVDTIRPTLVTTGSEAPTTSTDGTKVILTFSENIRPPNQNRITIEANGATLSTITAARTGNKAEITLATALTATATNLTVELASSSVFDTAGNGIFFVAATAVTNAVDAPDPADPADPPGSLKARRGNTDPLPLAWLARFGRTVADHVVDAIGERLTSSPGGGSQVTLGGQAIPLDGVPGGAGNGPSSGGTAGSDTGESAAAADTLAAFADRMSGDGAGTGRVGWGDGGGADGAMRPDSRTLSEREHPYARLAVSERLSLWGVLGYGTGDLTLAVAASGDRPRQTWRTETSMRMAAAGARGVLLSAADHGGFELAARGDARLVRMFSDAATGADGAGRLSESESQTGRLRFILEGSHRLEMAGGQTLTPSLELGLRHDGGDAETGTGIELGAGVSYADPKLGLTVEGKARGLVAHEDTDYREWGASASVRLDPGAAGRGLSLSLSPAWGADSGNAERLWGHAEARGLAANDSVEPAGRLDAEAGWGFGAFGRRGLATPFAGLALSQAGERTWRSGVRWTLGPDTAFGVEGTLREAANDNAGEHGVLFKFTSRW